MASTVKGENRPFSATNLSSSSERLLTLLPEAHTLELRNTVATALEALEHRVQLTSLPANTESLRRPETSPSTTMESISRSKDFGNILMTVSSKSSSIVDAKLALLNGTVPATTEQGPYRPTNSVFSTHTLLEQSIFGLTVIGTQVELEGTLTLPSMDETNLETSNLELQVPQSVVNQLAQMVVSMWNSIAPYARGGIEWLLENPTAVMEIALTFYPLSGPSQRLFRMIFPQIVQAAKKMLVKEPEEQEPQLLE